jgi:hypothetical protein
MRGPVGGFGALFVGLLAFVTPAPAQETTAFSDIDPGPRNIAMGGAAVARASDPTSAWWNPAGLYFMRGTQAVATYDDLYGMGLVKRNYLAFAFKKVVEEPRFDGNRMILTRDLHRGIAWGLSLSSVLVDLGEDSYNEFMPSLSVSGGLGDDVSFGVSLSYLRASSPIEGATASGYTTGIGAIVALPGPARAGVSVRNLLSRVFHENDIAERLSVKPTLGVSWPFGRRAVASGDLTWAERNGGPSRISVGGEYWILADRLAGRVGARRYGAGLEDRTVPSFGVGVRWNRLDVDYAFTADEDGPGSTHRFGLAVVLSRGE